MVWALGGLLAACGGESRSQAPPGNPSGGAGGSGGSGSGVAEYPPERFGAGSSVTCGAYKGERDVLSACNLVSGGDCPADLTTYLESIAQADSLATYTAHRGCGLIEIVGNVGLGGCNFDFGDDGTLVGYQCSSDYPYGACDGYAYQRGVHLQDCPSDEACLVAPDAAETGELCRCGCPESPPPDGVAVVDVQCVSPLGQLDRCSKWLDGWGDLGHPSDGETGRVLGGCGAILVELTGDAGTLGCVYDDLHHALVGERYTEAGEMTCSGVITRVGGTTYESCADEVSCVFGQLSTDPTVPQCGAYPYP
jgi:hypothetical protein